MKQNTVTRFRSIYANYQFPAPPEHRSKVVRGLTVLERLPLKFYTFKDHVFETSDPVVVALLKNSRMFGVDYYLVEAEEEKKPEQGNDELEVVPGVTSRNEAIAFLVQSKGAVADTFKGKKLPEIVKIAAETYNVVFTELSTS